MRSGCLRESLKSRIKTAVICLNHFIFFHDRNDNDVAVGSLQLSLYTTHQSLFQVGIGSLSWSSNKIISTSLLTGVGVCRRGWGDDKPLGLLPTNLPDSGGWFSLARGFESQTRSLLKSLSPGTDYKYFHMSSKWTIGWSLLIKGLLNQVQMVAMNFSSMKIFWNRRKYISQTDTFLQVTPGKE